MSETPLKKNFFEKIIKNLYFYFLKFLTPILIIASPELLSWLSHFNSKLRRLPSTSERINKKNNPLDEFFIYSENEIKFDEINVVMRGENLNDLDKSIPTFFINSYKDRIDFNNKYYCTSDRLMFKAMMGRPENDFLERFNYNDPNKKFFYIMPLGPLINNLNYKHSMTQDDIQDIKKKLSYEYDYKLIICAHSYEGFNIQIGSGILSVIALLKISKKVNVYGWDAFINKDLPKSFLKQTFKLWSPFSEFQPISRFSAIVLNWIFAHRLLNFFSKDRLNINGKVKDIASYHWIEKYLYRIIYKKN